MQESFTKWVESILEHDTSVKMYKTVFIELCAYKCNTDSLKVLYSDIDNLEIIIDKYSKNMSDPALKLDFFYELSVFISKYKLNIRI